MKALARRKLWGARAIVAALALAAGACGRGSGAAAPQERWQLTWGASLQLTEPRNMPPAPLAGTTLRQVIKVSVPGTRLRLRLGNNFGNGPLAIAGAHLALARGAGSSAIDVASGRRLTFGGRDSVLLQPGAMVTADPIDYPIAAFAELAITLRLGAVPDSVTGHPGSRTTSYLQPGVAVDAAEMPQAVTTDHWYLISNIDVVAGGSTVIALGNSITDGRGSGTNRNNRWSDNLARRLQGDARTRTVSVMNAGLGGNKVLVGGLGPPALVRFERDVVEPAGARWVILLEGVNDIGGAPPGTAATVARDLIAAYGRMVARAHERGLRIYGATILPFEGSMYGSAEREAARQTVNTWIRSGGAFDAVIDFDAGLRDPANPARLLPAADTGDHLHPNETGYQMMADLIDLGLFVP